MSYTNYFLISGVIKIFLKLFKFCQNIIKVQKKLDRLLDLRLDGKLGKEDFESKKRLLKERQYEISQLLMSYDIDDDRFTKACSRMVELLSNTGEYWRGSNNNEKRELLNFVFSNLEMKGATLCYTLRKPIDEFLNLGDRPEWRRRRDSNPRWAFDPYSLSRGAPSTTRPLLHLKTCPITIQEASFIYNFLVQGC